MSFLAKHRTIFSLGVAFLVFVMAIGAIFWARGFKPNLKQGKIERTGLIVATSIPTGAEVYLDDRLTSATNTSIGFLEPKTYKVRIEKDGYTTWGKEIEVKADLATEIKALLFPLAPEIKPLTTTGAASPTLSPDGSKIVYGVAGERGGLYSLSMTDRPLPFRQDPRKVAKNQRGLDFSAANFIWGPDSKQLIARFGDDQEKNVANLLIDTDKTDQDLRDITGALSATLSSWQGEIDLQAQTQAILAPDSVREATGEAFLVNSSALTVDSKTKSVNREPQTVNQLNFYPTGLVFSLDEEKILYKNRDGKYKVWDLKLKKDYTQPDFADFINIFWYPDSNHLVVVQRDLISIIEADGTNKMTVFFGKFENGFVFAHPSGSRLIILTTLTQPDGSPANLYSINLR